MQIGQYVINPPIILAPMAGVTDLPFRALCRRLGAGLAVSEMVTSSSQLWDCEKTRLRRDHRGEPSPTSVQIAGSDPKMMAEAARFNQDQGADIIDINMGCPAKKVCKVAAGSALLKDEVLVQRILEAVVSAVSIPVTLKIRTGWDQTQRNALQIAYIAEHSGIQALAIHGRTRQDKFEGHAEYDTIAAVKAKVSIPIIANGDIRTPAEAQRIKAYTGADAIMIGRAALGNPWIFQEIAQTDSSFQLTHHDIITVLSEHLEKLYAFYGDKKGVLIARKHILWYLAERLPTHTWRDHLLSITDPTQQKNYVTALLSDL